MTEYSNRIISPELANVIGYAEKPYIDLSLEDKSSHEVETLHALAKYAGLDAAKSYLADISTYIESYADGDVLTNSIEADIRTVLDLRIEDINGNSNTDLNPRVTNILLRAGIKDIRDILVLGKTQIADLPLMGNVEMDKIDAVIQDKLKGRRTWKHHPSIADIAEVCDDLDQVPIRAASIYIYDMYNIYDEIGSSERGEKDTIAKILNMPMAQLAEMCGKLHSSSTMDEPNYEKAAEVIRQAKEFAAEFYKLKRS